MPLLIGFAATVSDRAAVEKAAVVQVDGQAVSGQWRWLSKTPTVDGPTDNLAPSVVRAAFFPASQWPGHTQVTLRIALAGRGTGGGQRFANDVTLSMTTGAAQITTMDGEQHLATVRSDGHIVHTFPLSLGNSAHPTVRGSTVVSGLFDHRFFTDGRPGTPGYYHVDVQSVVQLSGSVYTYAAPWAADQIGKTNNANTAGAQLLPADADWFLRSSQLGDVVDFTHTNGPAITPAWP
ncbi:L,D-transpeptidase [Fodinicola feengrottensis]|nr:L,D-transpeptidase [Fodinicola feengrottensis]